MVRVRVIRCCRNVIQGMNYGWEGIEGLYECFKFVLLKATVVLWFYGVIVFT